jgi:hypothetical protein
MAKASTVMGCGTAIITPRESRQRPAAVIAV